ncbi:MAG: TetR/AcrR family transcriptional regulator [Alphaproteobacteria bacterium]|nr:TetR/AcrR family transcriptional regulator [Alphaproteobacteria bacterium]MBL6939735.1 TetR/AcrR family transcriptional regulator [Alphaproteobacteria bacterium]MBL7096943.1 TetR/AcrR family transcriptional regulator [Alphaproteobacteria bacterium]
MVRQSERRETTIAAILAAARKLFATEGFEAVSIDDIAAKADVAKGAVYHHFNSKEEIFTRVLEGVQAEIAAQPPSPALRKIADPLDRMAAAILSYLNAATEPGIKRILLIDGPAVIGWRKWREIDDRYFGAGARHAVAVVMGEATPDARLDAVTHAVMGMVMEAALVCATAPDARKTAKEMTAAMRKLLEGLRRPS